MELALWNLLPILVYNYPSLLALRTPADPSLLSPWSGDVWWVGLGSSDMWHWWTWSLWFPYSRGVPMQPVTGFISVLHHQSGAPQSRCESQWNGPTDWQLLLYLLAQYYFWTHSFRTVLIFGFSHTSQINPQTQTHLEVDVDLLSVPQNSTAVVMTGDIPEEFTGVSYWYLFILTSC